MIIKWVRLGLSHLIEYPYLNITWTGHVNPNWHPYYIPSHKKAFGLWESIISMYLANLSHQIIYLKFQKPFFFFWKIKDSRWEMMIIMCHVNHNLLDKLPYIISDDSSMFFFFFWWIWFVYVWGHSTVPPLFFGVQYPL